jgi:hypothetical protein
MAIFLSYIFLSNPSPFGDCPTNLVGTPQNMELLKSVEQIAPRRPSKKEIRENGKREKTAMPLAFFPFLPLSPLPSLHQGHARCEEIKSGPKIQKLKFNPLRSI